MTERPGGPSTTASCHSAAAGRLAAAGAPVVALVGSPNVGKSTLFNLLTGARRDVGNWPGTTVEVGRGSWRIGTGEVALIDLPGAYSLDPMSPDEQLTRDLLVEAPDEDRPTVSVVAVDATTPARSLYLLAQLRETRDRLVVALTMNDVAARRGVSVDPVALAAAVGVPVVALDPRRPEGAQRLAEAVRASMDGPPPRPRPGEATAEDDELTRADDRFTWIDGAVLAAVRREAEPRRTWSDRIDRVVTAPVTGPLVFLGTMWLVFQITTTVAAPLQAALDSLLSGPVRQLVSAVLDAVGLGGTWVSGLVLDGLLAGVGMLLTFLPLMALMFLLLAVLEDSGYLARAAVVTDRMMRSIGLPGRAFLPLVVGFGCNVPAVARPGSCRTPGTGCSPCSWCRSRPAALG